MALDNPEGVWYNDALIMFRPNRAKGNHIMKGNVRHAGRMMVNQGPHHMVTSRLVFECPRCGAQATRLATRTKGKAVICFGTASSGGQVLMKQAAAQHYEDQRDVQHPSFPPGNALVTSTQPKDPVSTEGYHGKAWVMAHTSPHDGIVDWGFNIEVYAPDDDYTVIASNSGSAQSQGDVLTLVSNNIHRYKLARCTIEVHTPVEGK